MAEPITHEHFINRELSLLEFHDRVLSQALDDTIPRSSVCGSCASPAPTWMNSLKFALAA